MRVTAVLVVMLGILGAGCGTRDESGPPPDVLLISIDTLRADHLGTFGYSRNTSPHIDAFAEQAVVFEHAYSTSYHTADSHMTMFTALYPSVHRVRNAVDPSQPLVVLSERIPTLTELLREAGYATAGFHGGGNVAGTFGFDRGFDQYVVGTVDDAIAWLDQEREQPSFLFFHTHHTHDPYTPSPPYDRMYDPDYEGEILSGKGVFDEIIATRGFAAVRDAFWAPVDPADPADVRHLEALYDGEINEMDEQVGRLIERALERDPDVIVAFVSDHGEEFQEHGSFLHTQLFNECLHVPFILRAPGLQPARVAGAVSLVDLAPTLLELAGVAVPDTFQGRSLVGVAQGSDRRERDILAEKVFALEGAGVDPADPRHVALIRGGHKVIVRDAPAYFDLAADPLERAPLGTVRSDLDDRLALLRRWNDTEVLRYYGDQDVATATLPEADVQRLRALGYVD